MKSHKNTAAKRHEHHLPARPKSVFAAPAALPQLRLSPVLSRAELREAVIAIVG